MACKKLKATWIIFKVKNSRNYEIFLIISRIYGKQEKINIDKTGQSK